MSSPSTTTSDPAATTTPPPPAGPEETPVPAPPVERERGSRRRRGPRLFTDPDPSSQQTPPAAGQEDNRSGDGGAPGFGTAPDEPGATRQPSGGRSTAKPKSPWRRSEMRDAIQSGVTGVSILAHENLARDELEVVNDLYIVTEAEAAGLAEPLSGLASRRSSGAVNPDVADVISALVVIATYVTRQLQLRAAIRKLRRGDVPAVDEAGAGEAVDQGAAQP
jgi:hypothetical protein